MSLFSMAMSLPPDFPRLRPPKVEVPMDLIEAHRASIAAAEIATPVLKCASEPPSKYSQFVERCTDFKDAALANTAASPAVRDFKGGSAIGALLRLMRNYHSQHGTRTVRELQARPESGAESAEQRRFLKLLNSRLTKPSKKQQQQQQQQQQQLQQQVGQQDLLEVSFNDSAPEHYLSNYTAMCSYCRRKAVVTTNTSGYRGNTRQRRYQSVQTSAEGLAGLPSGLDDWQTNSGGTQQKIGVLERLALLNTAAQRAQDRANKSASEENATSRIIQQQQQQAGRGTAAMIEVPESQLMTKEDVDAMKFQNLRQNSSSKVNQQHQAPESNPSSETRSESRLDRLRYLAEQHRRHRVDSPGSASSDSSDLISCRGLTPAKSPKSQNGSSSLKTPPPPTQPLSQPQQLPKPQKLPAPLDRLLIEAAKLTAQIEQQKQQQQQQQQQL